MTSKGRVVGVESKTTDDLISSWFSGRLHRQMRFLLDTTDIPVLMVRPKTHWFDVGGIPDLQSDIVKLQLMGVVIIWATEPVAALKHLRYALDNERNLRTAIARTDHKQPRGTEREQALQRAIPGVGPAYAKKLAKVGSLLTVLQMPDEELAKLVNKTVVANIRRLR